MKVQIFTRNAKLAVEFMQTLANEPENYILGYTILIGNDGMSFEGEFTFKQEVDTLSVLIDRTYSVHRAKYWKSHTIMWSLT